VSYVVETTRSAERELMALPKPVVRRIVGVFDRLAEQPRLPGCKKLKVESRELWRVRRATIGSSTPSTMWSASSRCSG